MSAEVVHREWTEREKQFQAFRLPFYEIEKKSIGKIDLHDQIIVSLCQTIITSITALSEILELKDANQARHSSQPERSMQRGNVCDRETTTPQ